MITSLNTSDDQDSIFSFCKMACVPAFLNKKLK